MDPKLFLMFPTPILKFSLDRHEEHKETYVPKVLEFFNTRKGNPSHFVSAQENSYLLMKPDSGLEIIDDQLNSMCAQYMNYLSGNTVKDIYMKSWFGVHTPEMHIQSHAHFGAVFSGVYYLQFNPEFDYPTTFTSPCHNEVENWVGGEFDSQNEHTIATTFPNHMDIKEGEVVLFPSWLSHFVPCSRPGAKERISFVFNMFLKV